MKKLIAGNWKMAISADEAERFDEIVVNNNIESADHVDWLICAPYPFVGYVNAPKRGAQDCSIHEKGAYTGEVSASMLYDMGCDFCIVGHSERRAMHGETDDVVQAKAKNVIANKMTVIICVGETLAERESGQEFDVVERQIRQSMPPSANAENCVIAYEPVWAIGTGKAATADDVDAMHNKIRTLLKSRLDSGDQMRIIYGGSVKPDNGGELLNLSNVDGALIGGASLKAEDFLAIGKAVNT